MPLSQNHWSIIIISPMVIATALLLRRKGALSRPAVVAIIVAVTGISVALFLGQ